MKTFKAPSVLLQAPDDWFDASTYVLAAPKHMGFTPTVVINVTRRVLLPDLKRHIDQQVYELQKLSGFQLVAQQPVTEHHGVSTGSILFLQDNNRQGPELFQKQVYYMAGQTIWCLTATCPANVRGVVMPPLEAVMSTFKPQEWEATNNGR
jgi:hypothetical protein